MAEKQLRVDIEVSAEIAKTFLQPDNEALLNTTIMFKGFKKSVAINDVLCKHLLQRRCFPLGYTVSEQFLAA